MRRAKSLIQKSAGVLGYELLPKLEFAYRREDHIRELSRLQRINLVLDVGARFGAFGKEMRSGGYSGQIASFEPVSDSFAVLASLVSRDPAWTAHRLALGSRDGHALINLTSSSDLASIRTPSDVGREAWAEKAAIVSVEEVSLRRLDGVVDEIAGDVKDRRILLKTDTQGWDLEVLDGARGILQDVVVLMIEVHFERTYEGGQDFLDEIRSVQDAGFAPTGIFPVFRKASGAITEADCVCVRADSSARAS